jgi:hypothetical protein
VDLVFSSLRLPHVKRVKVATDNCRKQYRNRNLYGWLTTFCKDTYGVAMGHLYQKQYHGKGLCDAICGLFKIQARRAAWGLNSKLGDMPKQMVDTHKKLAEFGRGKFCKSDGERVQRSESEEQKLPDDSSISKYEFSTLEKGEADEYPGNTLLYRTMQRELSMPFAEYKPVVKYDLSQHEVWCDNRLEGGDLRTREAICACDRCLEGR